jgi:RNA-binding protein Musashi
MFISTDQLREFFTKYGEIADTVVMQDRYSGKSRGFGFVTFKEEDSAQRVLDEGPHMLDGRQLDPKLATPREESAPGPKGGKGGGKGGGLSTTRVFVAKLPFDLTQDEFRAYFEKYGDVTDCYMPKNHMNQENKGFGFISYSASDGVDKLMQEEHHEIKGRTIAIDRADPKQEHGKGGGGGGGWGKGGGKGWGKGGGMGMGMGGMAMGGMAMGAWGGGGWGGGWGDPWGGMGKGAYGNMWGGPGGFPGGKGMYGKGGGKGGGGKGKGGKGKGDQSGRKIFVGRLDFNSTSESIKAYFQQFGAVEDAYVPKDHNSGKSRGFGFVTFESPHALAGVHRVSLHTIDGREVRLQYAVSAYSAEVHSSSRAIGLWWHLSFSFSPSYVFLFPHHPAVTSFTLDTRWLLMALTQRPMVLLRKAAKLLLVLLLHFPKARPLLHTMHRRMPRVLLREGTV